MASNTPTPQSSTQLVSHIPLIKNPSIRLPKPVESPQDIHPLPDDVTAWFVYPFVLETHAYTVLPQALASITSAREARQRYLQDREAEKERRRKEALKKVAPGWDGNESVLQPKRLSLDLNAARRPGSIVDILVGKNSGSIPQAGHSSPPVPEDEEPPPRDPMEDLVEGLERIDNMRNGGLSRS